MNCCDNGDLPSDVWLCCLGLLLSDTDQSRSENAESGREGYCEPWQIRTRFQQPLHGHETRSQAAGKYALSRPSTDREKMNTPDARHCDEEQDFMGSFEVFPITNVEDAAGDDVVRDALPPGNVHDKREAPPSEPFGSTTDSKISSQLQAEVARLFSCSIHQQKQAQKMCAEAASLLRKLKSRSVVAETGVSATAILEKMEGKMAALREQQLRVISQLAAINADLQRVSVLGEEGAAEKTDSARKSGCPENAVTSKKKSVSEKDDTSWPQLLCRQCDIIFSDRLSLVLHMESFVHAQDGVLPAVPDVGRSCGSHVVAGSGFSCDSCSLSFKTMSKYERHQRSHRKEKPFQCHVCHVLLADRGTLEDHVSSHKGERAYSCRDCNKSFFRRQSLIYHRRTHDLAWKHSSPHICPHCGRRFIARQNLRVHISDKHATDVKKVYSCKSCDKKFATVSRLNFHAKYHLDNKPNKCSFCEKSFVGKNELSRHLITHTGIKPFQCERCGQQFTQHVSLKSHMRTSHHLQADKTGDTIPPPDVDNTADMTGHEQTQYICSLCRQSFESMTAAQSHMQADHRVTLTEVLQQHTATIALQSPPGQEGGSTQLRDLVTAAGGEASSEQLQLYAY